MDGRTNQRGPVGRFFAALASLPFALTVVALLAAACVVGTVLPQGDQVAKFLHKNPGAEGWIGLLGSLGFTRVYSSGWFVGLLGLLALSLAVCTYRRLRAVKGTSGRARGRTIGSTLTHISLLLVMAGGVVRIVWGEKGTLPLREGDTRNAFSSRGKEHPLPFSVHLVKFEIEMYASEQPEDVHPRIIEQRVLARWAARDVEWALSAAPGSGDTLVPRGETATPSNSFEVKILRHEPHFVVDTQTREVRSRSQLPRNPAVLAQVVHNGSTNTQWLFALHPDFKMHDAGDREPELELRYQVKTSTPKGPAVKDYRSTLQIIENDAVVLEKTIEVNAPLSYKGYTLYQSGYNPRDHAWTSLQVVRDPGVPLVYAGFFLMIVGLAFVFYLYPQPGAPAGGGKETPC